MNSVSNKSEFMIFLIWLIALQLSGLYLFTKGFFLSRFEVPFRNSCNESLSISNNLQYKSLQNEDNSCWNEGRYQKVVLIIIDALRIDFTAFAKSKGASGEKYYLNHLPVVAEALGGNNPKLGGHARLFRFKADPPTVTMQRLKGLTTGSLPTFIDFRLNFASPHIEEDNLIDQFISHSKRITFMGDDTWTSLFPTQFQKSFPYESFNTRDLHTVDNGVMQHLMPELKRADWDILIAHFLGVDHVGHTFGPGSLPMASKLAQMDSALRDVLEQVDDKTLVLVMGDHGMTEAGNHGGASNDETGAALFLYSTLPLSADAGSNSTQRGSPGNKEKSVWAWDAETGTLKAVSQKRPIREVPQVSLVPTLALLLGVPIPYANLGMVLPELFTFPSSDKRFPEQDGTDPHHYAIRALSINARQVWRYLQAYATLSPFPLSVLEKLKTAFAQTQNIHTQYRKGKTTNAAAVCKAYSDFLKDALQLGEQLWTQYNIPTMIWGTGVFCISLVCLIFQLFVVSAASDGHCSQPYNITLLFWSVAQGVFLASLASLLAPSIFGGHRGLGLGCLVSAFRYTIWLGSQFEVKVVVRDLRKITESWGGCTAVVCLVMYNAGLFSNSYIEEEHTVLLFLATTCCLALAFEVYSYGLGLKRAGIAALAAVCLRIGSVLEGHGEHVANSFNPITSILPIIFLLGWEFSRLSRKTLNLEQFLHFLMQFDSYGCIILYWISETTELKSRLETVFGVFYINLSTYCPRVVYLMGIIDLHIAAASNFKTYNKIERLTLQQCCMNLVSAMTPTLIILLGAASPLSILLMTLSMQIIGRSVRKLHIWFERNQRRSIVSMVFLPMVAWHLSGRAFFYFTGHHSQFNRLQYSAAFIGFDDFSYARSGVLLFLNTFGTEIQIISGLPMLLYDSEKLPESFPDNKPAILRTSLLFQGFVYQLLAINSMRAFLTTCNVIIQRRHLMLWAIFAPKFVFEGTMHVVLCFSLLVFSAVYVRLVKVYSIASPIPQKLL